MDYDLVEGLKWYLVFLLSTSGHEAAHAWAAHRLGDDTAYRGGQVSLNPAPHLKREPFGMLIVPWLAYFMGGWMIGWASAPYNPQWALQYPRRSAAMALAGPGANWVLVVLAAILMRLGCEWGVFHPTGHPSMVQVVMAAGDPDGGWTFCAKMLSLFFSLNLILGALNLLPVPPLDGSNIPLLFLPPGAAEKYRLALRQPMFALIGLIVAWKMFAAISSPLFEFATKLLYSVLPAK